MSKYNPSIQEKANWLSQNTKEIGTLREGIIVTFEMPWVTLEKKEGKFVAVKCSCKQHSIHSLKKYPNKRCSYTKGAEKAYNEQ